VSLALDVAAETRRRSRLPSEGSDGPQGHFRSPTSTSKVRSTPERQRTRRGDHDEQLALAAGHRCAAIERLGQLAQLGRQAPRTVGVELVSAGLRRGVAPRRSDLYISSMLVLAVLTGVLLLAGAVALGILLQLRHAQPPPPAPAPASTPSQPREQEGPFVVEAGQHFISAFVSDGPVLRGVGPAVPRHFVDVRAEGDAIVLDYAPELVEARRSLALPQPIAERLAPRVRAWITPRDPAIVDVDAAALERDPAAWAGRVVRARGPWTSAPERSTFAGLWMSPPSGGYDGAREHVEVIGLVLWGGGLGHLGAWRGELVPFRVRPVHG
jgi:hypothetical protein